jgi:LysR family glycine cleavage system transcriptional activator
VARRLPPLKALSAFEAGARLLSFTRAAQDLSVTQTAISHQVRALEEWIGTPLFRRGHRKLMLTEAGKLLYPAVAEAFDRICDATERVRDKPDRYTLSVSVTPTFGSRWLAQRLGRFWKEYPDIDLRLHHSVHVVDFVRDGVDAAVRWGYGRWPGTTSVRLMSAQAVPMCSPSSLEGEFPLREPGDLRHHPLLHEKDYQEWTEWLAAAGVAEVDGQRGSVIDDPNAIIRAAVEGHGVMMGIPTVLAEELDAGRLVAPFGVHPEPELAYYFACPPGALERPMVVAFRDFLIEEARVYERGDAAEGTLC